MNVWSAAPLCVQQATYKSPVEAGLTAPGFTFRLVAVAEFVASSGVVVAMPVYSTTPIEQNCAADGVTVKVVEPPARLTVLATLVEPFALSKITDVAHVLDGVLDAARVVDEVLDDMQATAELLAVTVSDPVVNEVTLLVDCADIS